MRTGLWDGPIHRTDEELTQTVDTAMAISAANDVPTVTAGFTATVNTSNAWEGLIAWPGTTG